MINVKPITDLISVWQEHPASTMGKIVSLPLVLPVMVFFLIKKNIMIVLAVIILVALTGCWGAPYQNLQYQQEMHNQTNAMQSQAEAQRQGNWQTQQIQNRKPACTYNTCKWMLDGVWLHRCRCFNIFTLAGECLPTFRGGFFHPSYAILLMRSFPIRTNSRQTEGSPWKKIEISQNK